jgi:hypothetical protein
MLTMMMNRRGERLHRHQYCVFSQPTFADLDVCLGIVLAAWEEEDRYDNAKLPLHALGDRSRHARLSSAVARVADTPQQREQREKDER